MYAKAKRAAADDRVGAAAGSATGNCVGAACGTSVVATEAGDCREGGSNCSTASSRVVDVSAAAERIGIVA